MAQDDSTNPKTPFGANRFELHEGQYEGPAPKEVTPGATKLQRAPVKGAVIISDVPLESDFFNILVLGGKQSGKSALIEAIKNYARQEILDLEIPSYTPTTDVTSTVITTTLPRFSIFENVDDQDDGSQPRPLVNDDIREYFSLVDEEYEQQKPHLHIQKDQQKQNPYNFNFRLIDTPGLDFIKDDSKSILGGGVFVSKTLPAIVKQLGPTCAVHLVLLVVPGANIYDNSDAINFYRNILPTFDFITIATHRGIKDDNATSVSKAPQSRHKSVHRDSYAGQLHVIIDNLFIRDDPIRVCLARNDIRRVLELAILNEPVFMLPKKPPFIKDLDEFLEDRYSELLKTIHDAVSTAKGSSPFHTILQLTKIQCDEDARKETVLSSSPLKLIFSRRFENTWDALATDSSIEVEMESTEGEIAHVDILQHNVEIVKKDGGAGAHRLRLVFRWTSAFHGVLDIRIYVNATALSLRSNDTPTNITEAVQNAVSNSKSPSNQHKLIMEFLERYRHFHTMHRLTSATIVHPEAFQILTICDIDKTSPINLFECVENLETAYFNIADTYRPKISSPEKTSSEIIVGDGGSARLIYPAVNRFRTHLVDRRAQAPWSKIVYIESMSLGQSGDMQLPNRSTVPNTDQFKNQRLEMQLFNRTVEKTDYSHTQPPVRRHSVSFSAGDIPVYRAQDMNASYRLGLAYHSGEIVHQDYLIAMKWLLDAARQGHSEAQLLVGYMYQYGHGVTQDYSEALGWYQRAASQGNASAQYNIGVMYRDGHGVAQDFSKALENYEMAAGQGDAGAQHNIGIMYQNGHGIAQNYSKALEWYRKAASQGDPSAQYNIGVMYQEGEGVTRDYSKALEWYLKAASQGDAGAQYNIGVMYHDGHGVDQDNSKALEWYQKAADQGNASAQYNIGVMYHDGHSVAQDYSKALEWYQKAADQGNASAQYNIGAMYYDGHGVAQDYSKTLEWYQKAASQGDPSAQYNIGVMYRDGRGVAQDYSKALEWYQKAASQGDPSAQYDVGVMYQNSNGVAQDYSKALEWYLKAASQGNASAQNNIGAMYQQGEGVTQDHSKALKWYTKAANQGDANAEYNVGVMYQDGYGVVQDYSKALGWYQRAASQGNVSAQYNIGVMYQNGNGVAQDYSKALEWYLKAASQGDASAQYSLGCMYQCGYGVAQDYSKALEWYQKAADQGDTYAQRDIDAIQMGTTPLN
ncbi:hypothetical protein BGX26_012623 [Mortierella sp. AD094]|nr:hypothetical protein BGX26_012623 [Mortierella sp. AD094]